jgi:hypothetical protein
MSVNVMKNSQTMQYVVEGAMMQCIMGANPAPIKMAPVRKVTVKGKKLGNVMDAKPMLNITGFGMCKVVPNMPKPCVPATTMWQAGCPNVKVDNHQALLKTCICTCSQGGIIKFNNDGQM